MKKSVLFVVCVLIIISVSAFSLIHTDKIENSAVFTTEKADKNVQPEIIKTNNSDDFKPTDFYIDFGTRFSPLTKTTIENAQRVHAFLRTQDIELIKKIKTVEIIPIINDERNDINLKGTAEMMTEAQMTFLKNAPYSTNFVVSVVYERHKNIGTSYEQYLFTPHYTVAPETSASYKSGKEALISLLYTQTQFERIGLIEKKLMPAKLYFTVTSAGDITDLKMDKSSGYPLIDQKIKRLLEQTSGSWIPAKDANGNTVDQELVVTLGIEGC